MKLKKILISFFLLGSALLVSACTAMISGGFPSGRVDQEVLYLSGKTAVVALRPDGTQIWRYPEKVDAAKTFFSAPAAVGGQVIIGDYQNILFSLDANSGVERWTFNEAKGRYIASPLVVGETIVAPNGSGSVYGLDLKGIKRWKFTGKAGFWATPVANKDNTVVYVASMDHFLYALKVSDGSQVWAADLGGPMLAAPALGPDGILYVGTLGNQLIAVNSADGTIQWKYGSKGAIWSTPLLHEGQLYFGDLGSKVFAVRADTGAEVWSAEAPGAVYASPAALPDGLVFVCQSGEIFAMGYQGERSWTDKVEKGKLYSTPLVFGERLVVPVEDGDPLLVTFDFTGRKGWTFAPIK